MQRQYIVMNNGYRGSEIITTYSDVERKIRRFNNKAREAGLNLRIRLTGDSEEYAYYAELILPNKSKIPFLIRPNYDWGMYGRANFPQEVMDWYYKAWYLWKS